MKNSKNRDRRKNKNNGKRPRFGRTAVSVLFSLMSFFSIVSFTLLDSKHFDGVVTINGEVVTEDEFKLLMAESRAPVYAYFQGKYGAEYKEDFWESEYSGEIPIEMVREKTLERCVEIKVQQLLAKQAGVLADCSYDVFLQKLEAENKRRKEAVRQKKPLFGPVQYEVKGYYLYRFNTMVNELKEALSQTELEITEEELYSYYEEKKEKLFKKPDSILLESISLTPVDRRIDWANRSGDKEQGRQMMEKIREKVLCGFSFQEAAGQKTAERMVESQYKTEYARKLMDFDSRKGDGFYPGLKAMAGRTKAGEISPVFEDNFTFFIIRILERVPGGYALFTDYKGVIFSHVLDIKYKELVQKLKKEAKVNVNTNKYKKLTF